MAATERRFPAGHPAAQGHFPGNPIIPGAVLLSEAVQAIAAELDINLPVVRIRSAKFLHPTRPGDRVVIDFSHTGHGEIRFECTVDGRPVLTGQFRCHATSTAD